MPVTILHGHTSPETAHLVDDYPYGRILRCKIRYWVETAIKGAGKGRQRLVSQTTNPKASGEVWNKPKAGQYCPLVVLYKDGIDHVKGYHFSNLSMSPADYHEVRAMGMVEQFSAEQRQVFDLMAKHSYAPDWDRWATIEAHATSFHSENGRFPEYSNGQLEGLPYFYVGQQSDYLVMQWQIQGFASADYTAHDTLIRDDPEYAKRF